MFGITLVCRYIFVNTWWLGGLEVRRLPRDRKIAGSILTSGGGINKNIKFVIFLSHWSLGSEIRHLALSGSGSKQEVPCASCAR
jgi:hypothetical protein